MKAKYYFRLPDGTLKIMEHDGLGYTVEEVISHLKDEFKVDRVLALVQEDIE